MFHCEGDYWTVAYESQTWRLKDAKGLHYIAYLLGHPGEEIRVLDLVSRVCSAGEEVVDLRGAEDLARSGALVGDLGHAGELLDAQAKAEYQRRLQELENEIEMAGDVGNKELLAKAEDERAALAHELSARSALPAVIARRRPARSARGSL